MADRPRAKVEDFDREEIVRLVAEGLSVPQVGAVLKCSDTFLKNNFKVAIEEGREKRYMNMRVQGEILASMGLTQGEIAAALGVDEDTVKKHAGEEITKVGHAKLFGSLKRKMYERAMEGRDVMLIWLSKNYMNWTDNVHHEHSGGIEIEQVREQVEKRKAKVLKNETASDPELSGIVERVIEETSVNAES